MRVIYTDKLIRMVILGAAVLLAVAMLAACGQRAGNIEQAIITEPPVRLPDTLEELFDERNRDTDNGTIVSFSTMIQFPSELPTERISFSTPDRFAISFELRVAVVGTAYAFESLNDLPVEFRDIHIISTDGSITYEVTMVLEYEDLESVFEKLYSMGVVEEYSVTVWDMGSADTEDDFDWWQARWDENNTIALTIVEAD